MPFSSLKPNIEYSNRATKSRLFLALTLSLLANAALWQTVSWATRNRNAASSQPIEITRIAFSAQGKRVDKTVDLAQIAQRVAQIEPTSPRFSQSHAEVQNRQSQNEELRNPRKPRDSQRQRSRAREKTLAENRRSRALSSPHRVLDSSQSTQKSALQTENARAISRQTPQNSPTVPETSTSSNRVRKQNANVSNPAKTRQNAPKNADSSAQNGMKIPKKNTSSANSNAQNASAQSQNAQNASATAGQSVTGDGNSTENLNVSAPSHSDSLRSGSANNENRGDNSRFGGSAIATPFDVSSRKTMKETPREPTETPTPTPRPSAQPTPRPTAQPTREATPQRPRGMTRQARATRQVKPEIPENLRDEEFRKSVRARVSVSADGGFEVSLHGSSGNAQMDELALSALRKWRWKPALRDGEAIQSTQSFRIEFEVN